MNVTLRGAMIIPPVTGTEVSVPCELSEVEISRKRKNLSDGNQLEFKCQTSVLQRKTLSKIKRGESVSQLNLFPLWAMDAALKLTMLF